MKTWIHDPELKLSFGKDCKNNKEPLQTVTAGTVLEMIRSGDQELRELTKNLRSVLRYSKERYRTMKTMLPFFSCSVFDPPYRGVRNFKGAHGLILDIDYSDELPKELLEKLRRDPRIAMGYVSPSNAGVKLLFIFDEPIHSPDAYTSLYRNFSLDFAAQYHIQDHMDMKNCDVSRISFLCHDPEAWISDEAIPLDTRALARQVDTAPSDESRADKKTTEIPASTYRQILLKLNTRPRPTAAPKPLHPDITEVLPAITEELSGYGMTIKETESIQYGAKIKIYKDHDQGELNIYHGRQGYKVVTSPRKGTHPELNELARHIVEGVLARY